MNRTYYVNVHEEGYEDIKAIPVWTSSPKRAVCIVLREMKGIPSIHLKVTRFGEASYRGLHVYRAVYKTLTLYCSVSMYKSRIDLIY